MFVEYPTLFVLRVKKKKRHFLVTNVLIKTTILYYRKYNVLTIFYYTRTHTLNLENNLHNFPRMKQHNGYFNYTINKKNRPNISRQPRYSFYLDLCKPLNVYITSGK